MFYAFLLVLSLDAGVPEHLVMPSSFFVSVSTPPHWTKDEVSLSDLVEEPFTYRWTMKVGFK